MVDLRSRRQNIQADSTDVLPDERITPPANDLMMRLRERFPNVLPQIADIRDPHAAHSAFCVAYGQQEVINFLATLQTENKA